MSVKIIHTSRYPVFLGAGALKMLPVFLKKRGYDRLFVLVDPNTRRYCFPAVREILRPLTSFSGVITIPEGENQKQLKTCLKIWKALTAGGATRHSLLVNLGGGMLSDTGGFAASAFKRGMDYINAPTTLLAQADAAVGGKTGVNVENIKNHIGAFFNPAAVFADPFFLKTENKRQRLSGFAEIIKHALIGDRNLWVQLLDEKRHPSKWTAQKWSGFVARSIRVKMRIVEEDPLERDRREALNFGHTIGHALESARMTTRPLLHGEAVATGMVCEAYLSWKITGLHRQERDEITSYLRWLYPPLSLNEKTLRDVLRLLAHDKKKRGNVLRFPLLKSIGTAVTGCACDTDAVTEAIRYARSSPVRAGNNI